MPASKAWWFFTGLFSRRHLCQHLQWWLGLWSRTALHQQRVWLWLCLRLNTGKNIRPCLLPQTSSKLGRLCTYPWWDSPEMGGTEACFSVAFPFPTTHLKKKKHLSQDDGFQTFKIISLLSISWREIRLFEQIEDVNHSQFSIPKWYLVNILVHVLHIHIHIYIIYTLKWDNLVAILISWLLHLEVTNEQLLISTLMLLYHHL